MYHPPFCPNPQCNNHKYVLKENKYNWFAKDGFYSTKVFGKIQRYKCKTCKIRFSRQTFNLDYYAKKKINYNNLLKEFISTSNLSDMSRRFKVSHNTISNKIHRLSHQAIGTNSILRKHISLHEPFVADGFQSLIVNFYYPNNINILVGKNSQFLYEMNNIIIKRIGKLTEKQKADREFYENQWKADPKGVQYSFNNLLEGLTRFLFFNNSIYPIKLFTDKKLEYARAIKENHFFRSLQSANLLEHITISSKDPRDLTNPLFPVNYMDRQFRKDISEHVVKSVCFGKNMNNQMERLHIYQLYHNYLKKNRVRAKEYITHSDLAGIPKSKRRKYMKKFFTERVFISHLVLNNTESDCWFRKYETPLRGKKGNLPGYSENLPSLFYEEWCA